MKKEDLYEGKKTARTDLLYSFDCRYVCRMRFIRWKKDNTSDGAKKEVTDDLSEHLDITIGGINLSDSDSLEDILRKL